MSPWHPEQLKGLSGRWHEDFDMGKIASYKAGGKARFAYVPASIEDVCECLKQVPADMPILMVGRSTNLLVADEGFNGVAILLGEMTRESRGIENTHRLEEQAGKRESLLTLNAEISCPKAAQIALSQGLTGLEFMAGIPGSIGGALAMNAGSAGGTTWDLVDQVEMVDRKGQRFTLSPDDFNIGYREVHLKTPREAWFIRGCFRLSRGDVEASRKQVETLLNWRKTHQPLQYPNAGSVFRNPKDDSAGRLIEACGLKGNQIGQAKVSDCHANFIVNMGGASATDIIALMDHIQQTVEKKTGIRLQREVKVVGIDAS